MFEFGCIPLTTIFRLFSGVQYSEHSSFNELKRFVRFIKPRKVISTVPFSSKNMEKTPKVPHSWLNYELKPNRATGQTNIMDYMKVSFCS